MAAESTFRGRKSLLLRKKDGAFLFYLDHKVVAGRPSNLTFREKEKKRGYHVSEVTRIKSWFDEQPGS